LSVDRLVRGTKFKLHGNGLAESRPPPIHVCTAPNSTVAALNSGRRRPPPMLVEDAVANGVFVNKNELSGENGLLAGGALSDRVTGINNDSSRARNR